VPFKYLAQDFDLMYTTVTENVNSLSNGFKALKNYVEQLLEMVEMTDLQMCKQVS
jgi:hypothetical protein